MKTQSKLSAVLIGLIALIAFILSYNAIQKLAYENGTPQTLSYLVPLVIDGALVVFAVALLDAATSYNKKPLAITVLVGLFVTISIAFNIAHSNLKLIGIAIAVIAPFALFATFETLMWQIKQAIENKKEDLQQQLQVMTDERDNLQRQLQMANERIDHLEIINAYWNTINEETRVVIRYNAGEFETAAQAAELIGMHPATFGRRAIMLNGAVKETS